MLVNIGRVTLTPSHVANFEWGITFNIDESKRPENDALASQFFYSKNVCRWIFYINPSLSPTLHQQLDEHLKSYQAVVS